jgi:hypothetical protein
MWQKLPRRLRRSSAGDGGALDCLDDALKGASPGELHKLYVRNAGAFYRVGETF